MKKGKRTMIITLGIACFALTCVMFMQFKIVTYTDITSIENMREEELHSELANWKEKYQDVEKQTKEMQEKIAEYKSKKASNIETSGLVKDELKQAEILMGKTDIEGEGIEVTIKETPDSDFEVIKANNLLSIVNDLKYAGAEAISINDERIIGLTDIVDIGDMSNLDDPRLNTSLKINSKYIRTNQYEIKAIGNSSYLESSIFGKGGYAEQLDISGIKATAQKSNKIRINKYTGDIESKFMEEVN